MTPSAEPSSDIVVSRDGPVLILELDRAESMNAIGPTMLDSITGCLAEAERDDTVRAVVTTGRGPGWCAGADLDMLSALGDEGPDGVFHRTRGSSDFERAIDRLGPGRQALAMWDFPKPWIAAVNGAVAGGGLGLCLLHDVRFAAESAIFTTAFARIGVTVDMGLSFLLPRGRRRSCGGSAVYRARDQRGRGPRAAARASGRRWRPHRCCRRVRAQDRATTGTGRASHEGCDASPRTCSARAPSRVRVAHAARGVSITGGPGAGASTARVEQSLGVTAAPKSRGPE